MTDVLIIEPSKELSLVISHAFARKEFSTKIAHTSQEAIKAADSSPPKIVVIELLIPRHNGLEFIHEFRSYSDWVDTPIIIYSQISADDAGMSEKIKKDMGILEHFYKPTTTLKKLVERVEQSLR
ncbi:response regulator [Candidatus Saccharibacteria bacterium]|nr:response regulator [Candidatus Saccharibacteria bacterium]